MVVVAVVVAVVVVVVAVLHCGTIHKIKNDARTFQLRWQPPFALCVPR